MPEWVKGSIDGIPAKAPYGTSLLHAARALGIDIPTLCHHEGLPPDGNCRLCLCEVSGKLVASCMFPLRDQGFAALTGSAKVMDARGFVLYLMLNRAPKSPRLIRLAHDYEAYGARVDPRFPLDRDGCVRCGRCARVCSLQASEAIDLAGRGPGRAVLAPFGRPPEDCLGCLACALNCPTGRIAFQDDGATRRVWDRDFALVPCPACGERRFTKEQLGHLGVESALCPECRRRAMAREILAADSVISYKARG
ncbi:MAG: (2Fe-2S)-binding protein [Deltaproteobacteria bacterium]|jgi:NADH dehydrogenase/NADH:ubiquinone oxidoreductase subunit G|nr:(2Fe-2S)-binding protein [Deltaproteobacteria bacterium]